MSLLDPSDKPSLYVLDALNFLFRAFHALPPLKTTKGEQTGAIYGLCQMLLKIEREERPTHLTCVFDAPGDNFRNQIYAAYKAHRPPMPPELVPQVALVRTVVEAFGLTTLEVPGYEADDVIAALAKMGVAAGMSVVICSSDKDLLQLCNADVTILDTMKNRRLGPPEVREKWGVGPEQVGDVLALMGDSVDNVPGVPGIGPKTAAELINKYGTLDALLKHAGEVKGKRGEALVAARELVRTSRELVRLRDDVPLPKTLAELHRIEPDRDRLRELFRELEFSRLVDQLSPSGVAAIAPHAEEPVAAPPPVPETLAPAAPPPDARIVVDRAALAALAASIEAAGAVAVAALYDGPSAVRSDLVGLAFAVPRVGEAPERVYVPICHRYLGAPACVPEADVLAVLGPLLASPRLPKHVHDSKTLDVLLRRRGYVLASVATDPMIASYLLDASRARHDLDVVALVEGAGDVPTRASWMGTGRTLRTGVDIPVEEVGRRLAAEAAAVLALAPGQAAKLDAGRLAGLYRELELPLAGVLARIECRGVQLDADKLRVIGAEVA
ncbi:MAG TPA: 5'-3' exonuclease H3TH domain-containing protein, partial [Polyangia bacterium]|nr:5'-3' exonuclease H3TH domain-containing protein [Polyangia bacterium]